MACNQSCPKFRYITSATIVSGKLVLGLNTPIVSAIDTDKVCLRFSNGVTLPTGYETLPVNITVNGTQIGVLDKYANTLTGSDLVLNTCGGACTRYVYKGYYGTVPSAHVIFINAPRTKTAC